MFDCNVFVHNDLLCFGRLFLPLCVFWSGESNCKDSASEWNDKTKHAVFVFIPERRLSYEKIVQKSEKASSLLECFSERRLSYEKDI